VQGDTDNTFMTTRLELLLRDAKQYSIFSRAECLAFLGSHFRNFLPISERWSDEQAGRLLVDRYFFVHAKEFSAKLECLLHMLRKLFSFAEGKCSQDNADALMNHELLLPGNSLSLSLSLSLFKDNADTLMNHELLFPSNSLSFSLSLSLSLSLSR
jgi:DNA-directed RNA polymerase I subunit RPA2